MRPTTLTRRECAACGPYICATSIGGRRDIQTPCGPGRRLKFPSAYCPCLTSANSFKGSYRHSARIAPRRSRESARTPRHTGGTGSAATHRRCSERRRPPRKRRGRSAPAHGSLSADTQRKPPSSGSQPQSRSPSHSAPATCSFPSRMPTSVWFPPDVTGRQCRRATPATSNRTSVITSAATDWLRKSRCSRATPAVRVRLLAATGERLSPATPAFTRSETRSPSRGRRRAALRPASLRPETSARAARGPSRAPCRERRRSAR